VAGKATRFAAFNVHRDAYTQFRGSHLKCCLATDDELPKPFSLCRWHLQRVVPPTLGRLLQQVTAFSQDEVWGRRFRRVCLVRFGCARRIKFLGLFGITLEHKYVAGWQYLGKTLVSEHWANFADEYLIRGVWMMFASWKALT